MVHNKNQDIVVPRIKALEVLLKYFSDVSPKFTKEVKVGFKDIRPTSRTFNYIEKGCQLNLFDCSVEKFHPHQTISQRDFLEWFFKLKYFKNPNFLKEKYSLIINKHLRLWVEARRLNLFSGSKITYKVLQDFLYRNKVVEANFNQSFREGLVLDSQEINAKNYHNLKEIDLIQNNLKKIISNFEKKTKLTVKEENYLKEQKKNLKAFQKLKESLIESPYVLRQRPDMDPEVTRAIRNYDLQEVLYSHSYDYSRNAAYRKYNLVTGVKKMNGKVFLPGEVIDYWKIISDKRLWDFRYGWVIANGTEEWLFGGGICGSSSLVFLPSWKSGLEILERRNHSKYFTYLYPMEDIGLDATVFRPRPNLKMRNNTDSPIVFNVIDDKEKQVVTVEVIGNSTYKDVRIEGPIFVKWNHVKWIRHFEDFDGKIKSEILESRYDAIL